MIDTENMINEICEKSLSVELGMEEHKIYKIGIISEKKNGNRTK